MIRFDANSEIPVMEHFFTIQGEGFHQGKPAYFIRLAGCDVGCHWCDVKASWEVDPGQIMPIDTLVNHLDAHPKGICVITGGEPAMYDLGPLTRAVMEKGWKVHIETSGAYPFSGQFDWICVSPKKFRPALDEWLEKANEIKVIVFHKNDLEWAENFYSGPDARGISGKKKRYYLQPEWEKESLVLPLMVEYVKQNPHWTITMQIHKYMGVE
jgi:organic radical activating enzyme